MRRLNTKKIGFRLHKKPQILLPLYFNLLKPGLQFLRFSDRIDALRSPSSAVSSYVYALFSLDVRRISSGACHYAAGSDYREFHGGGAGAHSGDRRDSERNAH
jgi:hypothetical protein